MQILILRDYSSLTSQLQILEILSGNRQSSPRGPVSTEKCRTSQEQQEVIFDLPCPLPPGQDGFKQFPTPGTEGLDLSPGLPGGGW